jgi:hypothetical protein
MARGRDSVEVRVGGGGGVEGYVGDVAHSGLSCQEAACVRE